MFDTGRAQGTLAWLTFEHRTTDHGSPFLLDDTGKPFANTGDTVVLVGGYDTVIASRSVFFAGSIERIGPPPDRPQSPRERKRPAGP